MGIYRALAISRTPSDGKPTLREIKPAEPLNVVMVATTVGLSAQRSPRLQDAESNLFELCRGAEEEKELKLGGIKIKFVQGESRRILVFIMPNRSRRNANERKQKSNDSFVSVN